MKEQITHGWAGIDVGKGHHWLCLIDEAGTAVWSTKVVNDEAAILDAVDGMLTRAEKVVWGIGPSGPTEPWLAVMSWRAWSWRQRAVGSAAGSRWGSGTGLIDLVGGSWLAVVCGDAG